MTYTDIAGQPITVGCYVIYAALWDRSATLRYGKVVRLAERKRSWSSDKDKPTIRATTVDRDWDGKWEIQKKGGETTLGFLDRMLVIPETLVPADAKALLDKTPCVAP